MTGLFADYHKERDAFLSLLKPDCEKRILLFHGKSGTGKTKLMQTCENHVCDPFCYIPMQLRGSSVNVPELFFRAGSRIGWENLGHFTEQVSDLSHAQVNVNIEKNRQVGMGNMIRVALTAENPMDREERRAMVTEAWFEDIRQMENPVLMTMDTYEQASNEMKEWVSGPFLSRVAWCKTIRVAVAGQEVPNPNNIEWHRCVDSHELFGVREAEHWLPVVKAMRRIVPEEPQLSWWLGGICQALEGRPDKIIKFIEGLPCRK